MTNVPSRRDRLLRLADEIGGLEEELKAKQHEMEVLMRERRENPTEGEMRAVKDPRKDPSS